MSLPKDVLQHSAVLLGPDTPPRGVATDLTTGLARMQVLGGDARIATLITQNPLTELGGTRQATYRKKTHRNEPNRSGVTYALRVLDQFPDSPLRVVHAWDVNVHQGPTPLRERLWIGFFTDAAWKRAFEHAEFETQVHEPNPQIRTVRNTNIFQEIWATLQRPRFWASEMYAQPREGDLLPLVELDPLTSTTYLEVPLQKQAGEEIKVYRRSAESQVIEGFVAPMEQAIVHALTS